MIIAGWILGNSAVKIKQYERIVSVKGLSEREVRANVAVWPIRFSSASQDLSQLYDVMELQTQQIQTFLKGEGLKPKKLPREHPSPQINMHSSMAEMPMSPCVIRHIKRLPCIPIILMQYGQHKPV